MTLSVLAPTAVTTQMLTSSSVAETDFAAYVSTKAYVIGDQCISPVTHRIYTCLAACTGKDPTDLNNQFGPISYWLDFAPTNRYAMFDGEVSTQTTAPGSLTVTLRPGAFTDLYFAGLGATAATIVVKDQPGGSDIFNQVVSLEGSRPADYYAYFFDPLKPLKDLLISGILPYGNSELTVTLSAGAGTAKCGLMAIGSICKLGNTQYGAKAKPKTYSYIKTDDFGTTKIVRRKRTTDMEATASLALSEADYVLEIIQSLLDIPAVWIGSDLPQFGGLRCFGLGSGEISYDYPQDCQLSLTVQGLI